MLNGAGFDPAADGKVTSPYERNSFYTVFNYEINDSTQLTSDFRYTDVNSQNNIASEFSYGSWSNTSDFAADAELSDEVRELANSDGGWFYTPYGLNDLGPRSSRTDRKLYAFSTTVEGAFDNDWLWDVYVSAGKTENDSLLSNRTNKLRLGDSSNFTNGENGLCGVDDMSCPAWNSLQPMSQEVIDYVTLTPYGQQIDSEQFMFAASVSGDLYELPAGDLMFAFGIEGRRENIEVSIDDTWQDETLTGSQKLPWNKGRNIYDAFIEIEAPLVSDVFLVDELILNLAARYSDYQYAGSNTTWKAAIDWAVTDEFRIRSTFAHAVRAPQLVEMFGSTSIGFSSGLSDPCDQENITTLKADLKAQVISNCQAFGVEDPENFESATNLGNGSDTTTSGNPHLDVEEADTFTFGFVIQPSFLENFALTVDYYDIDLTNAIENISAGSILYECAESSNISASYACPLVSRNATGNVSNILVAPVNKGAFTRRGLDIETSYDTDLPIGQLSLKFYATHIIELSTQSTAGEERFDYSGVYGSPDWKGRLEANYTLNELRVNWSIDYTQSALVGRDKDIEDYSVPETPSSTVSNVRISYDLNVDTNLYIGARNVFDKKWTHHPSTSGGRGAYNLMGRFLYAGFSYNF
jgi:outer membrane receptor protein involved in Fe transport